jgi:tryptophan synthase alpha chain
VLEIVSRASLGIPVVLFSYLNPLLRGGADALQRAADAGAHGVLVVDLPLGADPEREAWFGDGPLAFIRLVAPTTPQERMSAIARTGSGFVYLVSRLGVTGERTSLPPDLPETIARVRAATDLPLCVGFGISRPEQARAVAQLADGGRRGQRDRARGGRERRGGRGPGHRAPARDRRRVACAHS